MHTPQHRRCYRAITPQFEVVLAAGSLWGVQPRIVALVDGNYNPNDLEGSVESDHLRIHNKRSSNFWLANKKQTKIEEIKLRSDKFGELVSYVSLCCTRK